MTKKTEAYALRLTKKHPRKQMAHGNHMIMPTPFLYDLTEDETALLKTTGPAHWISVVDKKGISYKVKTKKEMEPKERLALELKELGVELKGTETIKQLDALMLKQMKK